jgi:hypothetical protein
MTGIALNTLPQRVVALPDNAVRLLHFRLTWIVPMGGSAFGAHQSPQN